MWTSCVMATSTDLAQTGQEEHITMDNWQLIIPRKAISEADLETVGPNVESIRFHWLLMQARNTDGTVCANEGKPRVITVSQREWKEESTRPKQVSARHRQPQALAGRLKFRRDLAIKDLLGNKASESHGRRLESEKRRNTPIAQQTLLSRRKHRTKGLSGGNGIKFQRTRI